MTLHYFQTLHSDVPSIIIDVLNIADAETSVIESQNEDSKERLNFSFIVKECEKVNETIENIIGISLEMFVLVSVR